MEPAPSSQLADAPSAALPKYESLELPDLLHALRAMRNGDFSVRIAGDRDGVLGKIADTFNEIVAANERMAQQLDRVETVVGREGLTRQRVKLALTSGAWGEM